MRKIVAWAMVSMDGVMQAPSGPDEDAASGFDLGGWATPHMDGVTADAMGETFSAAYDLLLGRKTYDIFASYWPSVKVDPKAGDFSEFTATIARRFNECTKFVATHRPETLTWQTSRALGPDVVAAVRELKAQDGPMLLTQGSTDLIQTLLAHDLVDEVRVFVCPVVLGRGKKLFGEGTRPGAFTLTRSTVSPKGVVCAHYQRSGRVITGAFTPDQR